MFVIYLCSVEAIHVVKAIQHFNQGHFHLFKNNSILFKTISKYVVKHLSLGIKKDSTYIIAQKGLREIMYVPLSLQMSYLHFKRQKLFYFQCIIFIFWFLVQADPVAQVESILYCLKSQFLGKVSIFQLIIWNSGSASVNTKIQVQFTSLVQCLLKFIPSWRQ